MAQQAAVEYETRDQIPEQAKWDLTSIYESDDAFLKALENAQELPGRYESYQGKIAQSPKELLAFLRMDDAADVELGKLINYAQRRNDEDTREARCQDFVAQVMSLYVAVSTACSWFTSELLSLSDEQMDAFYAEEPDLELYRRNLNRTFARREHVLSPAEEKLLARTGDISSQPDHIFSMFNDADLTFPDAVDAQGMAHPVTHGTYIPLMTSPDRTLRKSAYDSLYGVYGAFRNTSAAMLGFQAKVLKFHAEARRYPSALAAALDGNEVPVEVYTNLIDAVHRNMDALHKYTDLRKRVMGLDELHFYDLYTPLVADAEMSFSYEQACEIILQALKPMGEEYLAIVRRALDGRWIDVYETPGKRSGAYSAGSYGMHPVMLLNFQGTLDDVFTLVHEMGHSIHTYLSCQNQPSCYSDYVIFVAEVASTCNEALLMQWFLDNTTDERQRAYLLNHYLEQFRATLYRQTMFAEFELWVSELAASGAGITAEALCEKYAELNRLYFGEGIVVDDQISLEWARIPHFYYDFYVYQYATGYAAAIALSQRILQEGEPAVKDYLGFLSGGCSKPPIELLRGAGVDMATAKPIDSALKLFDGLLDQMAELLGRL